MDRVSATYEMESALGMERAVEVVAGEQSTGTFLPLAAENDALRERSAARIEHVEITGHSDTPALPYRHTGEGYERGRVTISWPVETFGYSLPTLIATVAGNLSELAKLSALRLPDIALPPAFPGPQFGIEGTRRLTGGESGVLIGTIKKPSVSLDPEETAALVVQLDEPAS